MSQEWYVRHNGKVVGPITSAKLKQLAWAAKIRPATEVRLGDSGQWIQASRVKGLLGQKKQPQERSHQQAKSTKANQSPASGSVSPPHFQEKSTNPYQPPAFHEDLHRKRPAAKSATISAVSTESAEGLNRLYWVLSAIALWGVVQGLPICVFMSGLVPEVPGIFGGTVIAMTVVGKVGQIALAWQRLKNTGNNPWWSLASLISITNSILKAYCCIAPPNYAISKKLDTPGKIMTALMLIVIAVSVGILIAGSV